MFCVSMWARPYTHKMIAQLIIGIIFIVHLDEFILFIVQKVYILSWSENKLIKIKSCVYVCFLCNAIIFYTQL